MVPDTSNIGMGLLLHPAAVVLQVSERRRDGRAVSALDGISERRSHRFVARAVVLVGLRGAAALVPGQAVRRGEGIHRRAAQALCRGSHYASLTVRRQWMMSPDFGFAAVATP